MECLLKRWRRNTKIFVKSGYLRHRRSGDRLSKAWLQEFQQSCRIFRKTAYFDKNPEYNRRSGIDIPTWYDDNLISENCNNMQNSEVRRAKWSLSNVIYI